MGALRRANTVDDVHAELLERISSGALPLGSKLPSCRALAAELGSNPTTVSRALGRLAEAGLVRTEQRQGTFVAATEPAAGASVAQIRLMLEHVVNQARPAGLGREQLARMLDEVLAAPEQQPRVAFVECNEIDLGEMADLVEHATGVDLDRVRLADLTKKVAVKYDAIATPIFHLADVYAAVGDLDRVIELNFVPTASSLRQLASIDPELVLGVATPLRRGVDRLSSLVRQYFAGEVRGVLTDGDDAELDGIDVLVYTNASQLSDRELSRVRRHIRIVWELEHNSGSTFRQRLDSVAMR